MLIVSYGGIVMMVIKIKCVVIVMVVIMIIVRDDRDR